MISMSRRCLARVTIALCAIVTMATGGFALTARAQQPDTDPPARVARLSELYGQVWIYSPDSGEWVGAVRNQPLTSGDRVATESGARAELQIGSTSLRIDSASELELVEIGDERAALALQEGSVIARVRDPNGAGELDLSTEEGRFVVPRAGSYRFDRQGSKTDLTVYAGQARYEGPNNSGLAVNAGQRAQFWIDSGGVAQYSVLRPVDDEFMAWSGERDRQVVGSIAERYVSPEMTGAGELDAYGRWEQTPDYGSVWIPTAVAVDWAPYSHGRWAWVRPWGWTWIDDAPWGFAPFHYGRWVYLRNRWCWTPGARVVRPVYAPALVAWVGGPRGTVSVTIGGGPAVGWFPLAPREVYVPSYRVSPRYARNVNITQVTNVTVINNAFSNPQEPRDFQNRRAPRAITVVPSSVMTERRPVAPAAAQYRQTPWVRELAAQPGRTAALVAPPVTAPAAPARTADPRNVRPPPGFAERPGVNGRAGGAPRERNEADRDRPLPPRDAQRPQQVPGAGMQAPAARGQAPGSPVVPDRAPVAVPPPRQVIEPADPRRPGFDPRGQRPEQRPGVPARGPGRAKPPSCLPGRPQHRLSRRRHRQRYRRPSRPVQPRRPHGRRRRCGHCRCVEARINARRSGARRRPRPPWRPRRQVPTMRPLPVRRGEDQRPEERRAAPPARAGGATSAVATGERPAPPAVQSPTAAAPTPAPRPVDVQRPAPAVAPAAPATPRSPRQQAEVPEPQHPGARAATIPGAQTRAASARAC